MKPYYEDYHFKIMNVFNLSNEKNLIKFLDLQKISITIFKNINYNLLNTLIIKKL